MRRVRYPIFDHLPDHTNEGHRFLYVAQLCDGAVKIGRTWNPRGRMASLSGFLRRTNGKRIVRVFIQPTAHDPQHAEAELIRRVGRIGTPRPWTREFFDGVSFGAAVTLAKQLAQREFVELCRYSFWRFAEKPTDAQLAHAPQLAQVSA